MDSLLLSFIGICPSSVPDDSSEGLAYVEKSNLTLGDGVLQNLGGL